MQLSRGLGVVVGSALVLCAVLGLVLELCGPIDALALREAGAWGVASTQQRPGGTQKGCVVPVVLNHSGSFS